MQIADVDYPKPVQDSIGQLTQAVLDTKARIWNCSRCGSHAELDPCGIRGQSAMQRRIIWRKKLKPTTGQDGGASRCIVLD
jgi:hypothetical protein